MTAISTQTTVGELVRARPELSRIFEDLKIDYCCGGKIPLAEACAARGLDAQSVLRRLEAAGAAGAGPSDPDGMGLAELADHIVATHHAYLRRELPHLDFMTQKVAAVHADHEPRLIDIREIFLACRDELEQHTLKEEAVLFPMIRELERSDGPVSFHCGTLANPIRVMEREHQDAGDALARFRELTDDYTPPDWACNTFRAMYAALADLERDMHTHVHKENNILFPRALQLEAQRTSRGGA